MKADFTCITGSDGFTSIFPNTQEAEREYNHIFAETGGIRLAPWEFDKFRENARSAGYSVRKQSSIDAQMSAEELAGLLGNENETLKSSRT